MGFVINLSWFFLWIRFNSEIFWFSLHHFNIMTGVRCALFLWEVLNNGKCSLLMIIVFVLDISGLGQLHSAVEGLLLCLLGEVLHDGQHCLLVVIMVIHLHVVWLDVNQVDAWNTLNGLLWEILNDCQSRLVLIRIIISFLVVSVVVLIRLNVESLGVSLSLIHQ